MEARAASQYEAVQSLQRERPGADVSFNCYWEPLPPPSANRLPQSFKYVVARRWFDHDGTLRGERHLGVTDLGYLRGILDSSTEGDEVYEGAQALIEAITDHGDIRFWIGDSVD